MTIVVGGVTAAPDGDDVVLRADVQGSTVDDLWFQVPGAFADLLTDRIDPFAIALLAPAMRHGHDLHLDGTVTDELLFHLNQDVQQWVRSILPMYQAVRVTASRTAPAPEPAPGVATGFSAGVDSFSVIDDYLLGDVPDALRVTHLLYNDVGPDSAHHRGTVEVGYANARRRADAWGVPLVSVHTNLDAHYVGTNTAVANTITLRNAAVAHALAGGVGRWYHASSVSFDNSRGGPSPYMEVSDPISLPLLSTPALALVAVGAERSRVDKTLQVMRIPDAPASLNVCIDGRPDRATLNCSRCGKCVRTLATLEIAGRLHEVDPRAFDVAVYRRHRDRELALLLQGRASVDREVIAFARTAGWRFPAAAVRQARALRWRERTRSVARRIIRRGRRVGTPR